MAGRRAEDARPRREQPGHVGGDQMFVIRGVGERVPLPREVEGDLGLRGARGRGAFGGGHNLRP